MKWNGMCEANEALDSYMGTTSVHQIQVIGVSYSRLGYPI